MHEKIKNKHFFPLFNSLQGQYSTDLAKSSKPNIIVKQIHTIADLNKIPNQPGFYLIFTDYQDGFKDINSWMTNEVIYGNARNVVMTFVVFAS